MKVVLIVVGVLVIIGLTIYCTGLLLPVKHTASREARFVATPEAVWSIISDFAQWPSWRTGLRSVDVIAGGAGTTDIWRETDTSGHEIRYSTIESVPIRKLVRRIVSDGLPFGGQWTFDIAPAEKGCILTITEDGEIYNLIYRFVSKFVIGHTTTIEKFIGDLQRKLGGG